MGRHTRLQEPDDEPASGVGGLPGPGTPVTGPADPAPAPAKRRLRVPVPLLPIFALVVAIGVVSYAFSTQQISLNFAAPAREPHAEGVRDSQVSRHGKQGGLTVAFRLVERRTAGFTASVTVANRGAEPVARWSLAFVIPHARVLSATGAEVVETGRRGWVRSPKGSPALEPGESVKVVFRASGKAAGPSACVINRVACTRA
ncbi:cellulose binding domain-containing protein [Actinomadura atramentaria]|uniref:cellulose binding domain-containing protein n=1 Tax=Actinomadura atramentaria TaxID=1990 RepID=UPI00035E37C5|nr:cellulose binding domain-containing protein [Actinomadura atramentaria]